eukprot:CAMPEP_0174299840 /NCGR_PEP_ID=MMETSP0809-20121228/57781_1 /TAXON_ID=73025 ORGANISM="Eutreptiella gymnastica-like, Strain CCMP1594" /NCGR_SAMPLE_ID=MMETSP0809 /ASSEMBLY_ACC=CAM_ASM_000658 /LENGTH=46 /DNA_ID= /DNA_START= /DNA_END= /DNA_ORIENTATION=
MAKALKLPDTTPPAALTEGVVCIVEVQTAVSTEVHQSHEKKKGPPR